MAAKQRFYCLIEFYRVRLNPQQYHVQVLQLLKQKHPANFSHTKNPPHVMLSMSCYHSENFFSDLYFEAILKLLKKNGSTAGVSAIVSLQNQTSYKKLEEEEMQPEQVTVSSYKWWKIFQQWNDIKEKL